MVLMNLKTLIGLKNGWMNKMKKYKLKGEIKRIPISDLTDIDYDKIFKYAMDEYIKEHLSDKDILDDRFEKWEED